MVVWRARCAARLWPSSTQPRAHQTSVFELSLHAHASAVAHTRTHKHKWEVRRVHGHFHVQVSASLPSCIIQGPSDAKVNRYGRLAGFPVGSDSSAGSTEKASCSTIHSDGQPARRLFGSSVQHPRPSPLVRCSLDAGGRRRTPCLCPVSCACSALPHPLGVDLLDLPPTYPRYLRAAAKSVSDVVHRADRIDLLRDRHRNSSAQFSLARPCTCTNKGPFLTRPLTRHMSHSDL